MLFTIPQFFILQPREKIGIEKEMFLWISAIIFFYVNYFILVPKLLTKQKFLLYTLSIITILNFIFFSSIAIDIKYSEPRIQKQIEAFNNEPDRIFDETPPPPPPEFKTQMLYNLRYFRGFNSVLFIFVVLAVSTSIKITSQWYANEKTRKETENQKLNAELSFLKSQINPHFFFNTLNSIYSLASKKSDKTPEAIIKLSQLMRYIIYDSEKELVPLKNEIEYIANFVELQKLRIKENVHIDLSINGPVNDKWIEPMLLLPFIENAFKHGIDYTRDCVIRISIKTSEGKLFFETENQKVIQISQPWDNGNSGIGLANSKKRLNLLYPESHSLKIFEENNLFNIRLELVFKSPKPTNNIVS
jgi:hypothetical protein